MQAIREVSDSSIHHTHSHSHSSDNKSAQQTATSHLTISEVAATNTTGKPSYGTIQAAAQISRDDRKWDGGELATAGSLTYSFLSNSQAEAGYQQLSSTQIAAAQKAMAIWSSVANVTFVWADENSGQTFSNRGEMQFQGYNGGGGGWASYGWNTGGPTNELTNATVALGGNSLSLALHEVGHAIALSHPGTYNGAGSSYTNDAIFFEDTEQYSVMSYWNGSHTGADLFEWRVDANNQTHAIGGATGLGLYDIDAIQRVYGANTTTYSGNTTYGFNSNTGDSGWTLDGQYDWIQAAIWDVGGIDTIDASGYSDNANIDLRESSFSSIGALTNNLAIAAGVVIENATGGSGNDTIRGNSADNVLSGNDGTDTLSGHDGNDNLFGGASNDVLNGGQNDDILEGGSGADQLNGGQGNDSASYLQSSASVTVNLTDSSQNTGDAVGDLFSSIESIIGSSHNDMFVGDSSSNIFFGGAGSDQLFTGAGEDILDGGAGGDVLSGGTGVDIATYRSSNQGVSLDLIVAASTTGDAINDTFVDIEIIEGSNFSDSILGDNNANTFRGGIGNDGLFSRGGNDVLEGGAGGDILNGGSGVDTASYKSSTQRISADLLVASSAVGDAVGDRYFGIENLEGSDFSDSLLGDNNANKFIGGLGIDGLFSRGGNDVLDGGAGGDILNGGAGLDTASYGSASQGVTADLVNQSAGTGDAAGDLYIGIENLEGSGFNDSLYGDNNANTLSGSDGVDSLIGRDGNDILDGGSGSDILNGGSGLDTASYRSATHKVYADFIVAASATGDAAGDTYIAIENFEGSSFSDSLIGDNGANNLSGLNGSDGLFGRGGNDTLRGGRGSDVMNGGAGEDTADYTGYNSSAFTIVDQGAGRWTVTDNSNGEIDTLISIETLQFDDLAII